MHPPQKPDHPGEFDQVLRHIQSILGDEEQRRKLLGSQGDFAQEWLDLFQLLAEYPKITINLQSSIFKLMIRLSRNSGLHPQCLTIWGVEKLGDDPVGGGAFGDVWQGRIGQQLVCLKVVRAFRRSDIQLILKDYMQEAIIWRQLDHPNVLPFMGIYYLDKEQKRLCLVSPWMERGNLIDFMSTSPDLVDHDLLAYDVACGLSYLHAKKIVHGDLKGVNILITPELRACLGDFGLSRVSATQVLVTETSRSKGTMRWLSPELMRPGPSCVPSRESDVYAYACVCYEIFTGRVPFYELVEAAIVFAVLMDKQHPTRPEDCTKLRGSMWDVMTSCWDETPSSRPAIADVLTRIHEMNADRILEPASSWNNPVFTRVWNDPEHPPVTSEIHEQAVKGFIADETYAWSLPRSPSGSRSGTGTTERPDNQPHGASTSGSDRTVIDVPTDLVLEPVTTPTIPSPSLGGPKTIKGSRTFVPETVARIVTPEGVEVSSDKSKSERHASSGSITSLPTGSAVTLSTAILNPKGPNAKTLKKKEAKRRKKEAEERAKKAAVEKEREVEQKRNEEEQRKREELNKKEHPRGEQSAAVGRGRRRMAVLSFKSSD
ncbi:kinase-like protein [Marasmius fiardii PR-910]|nr:kinase-like protein [Marasmius fiardii PR-910]